MSLSIRNKLLISFIFITSISLMALISSSYEVLNSNNEYFINKEVTDTKNGIDLYLKQYFLGKTIELNETSIRIEAPNLSKEISNKLGTSVTLYNTGSQVLYSMGNSSLTNSKDLTQALAGNISYTIDNKNQETTVYFSYPIVSNDGVIAVLRYSRDYTYLFSQSYGFLNRVIPVSVLIFIVSVFLSYLISKQITKPITTLTTQAEKITEGNWNVSLKTNSNKDEVSKLSKSFKLMVDKIKSQLDIISKDRDTLKELSAQQKNFFDNVTHELKTPITTIVGYGEILKDNGFTDEEFFNRGINKIVSEGNRLSRMVVQLLELSKISSNDFIYEFKEVNLSKVVKNTAEELSIKAHRYGISINLNVLDDMTIYGDEDKIKEVIINILDNSIKYGYPNSSIKITSLTENSSYKLIVQDEGIGIKQTELENIFSPFYRATKIESKEKGSTGLGLSIVKNILTKHNASIDIKSKVDVGTKVTLTFPKMEV
ncbi:HAMP domain-containing sensor histidine kinase [Clostridium intestinale]|uniref:sensor histidine kinase n=1 Tax=Clostridium intestinale TaxID=36845 RepID=UPI0028EA55A5|nr:HAMP domain-containing sensor histidine kinase [Clostridium intestinale]